MTEPHHAPGPSESTRHPLELSGHRVPELPLALSATDLAPEVARLKREVASLQRQMAELRGSEEKAVANVSTLSSTFEKQRRELMDEVQAQAKRARDAERELTLSRASLLEKAHASTEELEKLRPAVTQVFTALNELLELLPEVPRSDRSEAQAFLTLGRDLNRIVKAVRKLRSQFDEGQGRQKNLLEQSRDLKRQFGAAQEAHQHELSETSLRFKGDIATLTTQLAAARNEAEAVKTNSARRLQLLDQLLEEKRNAVPERSAADLLHEVTRLSPILAEGRLRTMNAVERGQIVSALATDQATRAVLAQAIAVAEEQYERIVLGSDERAPEAQRSFALCAAYAQFAADAVCTSGNLEIVFALSPAIAGKTLDRLPDRTLRALFGEYLADPTKSHILHSSKCLMIVEELPVPSRVAAALLAPTVDDSLIILCGGSKVRHAVLDLRAQFPRSRGVPWIEQREQKEGTLAARSNEALFQDAAQALCVLDLVPFATLDAILNPYLNLSDSVAASLAVLGFDLRDALLLAPETIRTRYLHV